MPSFAIGETKFLEYNEDITDDIFLHKSKDIAHPVKLNPYQVRQLFDKLSTIDEDADILWKALPTKDKREHSVHIGWRHYLTVLMFNGARYYDIRAWWQPPGKNEPSPTKSGIRLTEREKNNLCNFQVRLYESITAIRNVEPCLCFMDHLQYLNCERCNPLWG